MRGGRLDGAVLDINLRNERVYSVADVLAARGVPFVFTTGYDAAVVPRPYSDAPRCEKPVDKERLIRCLSRSTFLQPSGATVTFLAVTSKTREGACLLHVAG